MAANTTRWKIEANEVYLAADLMKLIPKLHERKLKEWIAGVHVVGEKQERIVSLRCFWFGETRLFLGAWVLEFFTVNSSIIRPDDGKKVDSEGEGGPQS